MSEDYERNSTYAGVRHPKPVQVPPQRPGEVPLHVQWRQLVALSLASSPFGGELPALTTQENAGPAALEDSGGFGQSCSDYRFAKSLEYSARDCCRCQGGFMMPNVWRITGPS